MKIRTIIDANKSLTAARTDLNRCLWAQNLRDMAPKVYKLESRQDLLKFYMSQWPEFAGDKDHRTKWSDQLDLTVDYLTKYIEEVETWVKHKLKSRANSCLPKKRQRELGLLPPVEMEIAIREGRI